MLGPLENFRVLIIEDDSIVVDIIEETLKSFFNSKTHKESCGKEAMALFEKYASDTSCVILDYGIPDMHASRILSALRETNSNAKVILASGYPKHFVKRDFPLESIDSFLAKPFSPRKLALEVERLINK